MRPIETNYKGYLFRSRIEARWAVFFDSLGVVFEYEKEGYQLRNMRYLPDFWLPQQDCWVEIKGQQPTELEEHRASLLAKYTQKKVYLFAGAIPLPNNPDDMGSAVSYFEGEDNGEVITDEPYWWCECPTCGLVGICFSGWISRLPCRHHEHEDIPGLNTPRLLAAYIVARSARF
jgi:hypothetical protein